MTNTHAALYAASTERLAAALAPAPLTADDDYEGEAEYAVQTVPYDECEHYTYSARHDRMVTVRYARRVCQMRHRP